MEYAQTIYVPGPDGGGNWVGVLNCMSPDASKLASLSKSVKNGRESLRKNAMDLTGEV